MDFIEATHFSGPRPGYVFKKDKQGLGYYQDALEAKKTSQGAADAIPEAAPSSNNKVTGESTQKPKIKFTNDGSFLEKFKEKQRLKQEQEAKEAEEKRRHEKLKRKMEKREREMEKKSRQNSDLEQKTDEATSAWQAYLDEVKEYESQTCKEYSGVAIVK
eukprot:m.15991 g.15991  ORF g.15991 m.15991 type:complete len:160 (-) comp10864_c0_seq1:66-545(-)